MQKTIESSSAFIEQAAAQAGIMAAHAANAAYDPSLHLLDDDRQFQQLQQAAELLIGEGTTGGKYLSRHLATNDEPVTLVAANWYDISAQDFGLRPRKQKQEHNAIEDTITQVVAQLNAKYGIYDTVYSRYAVLKSATKLIIANASDTGVALYGNMQRSRGVDISDETGVDFAVTINGKEYDTRDGMTRSVYDAIKAIRRDDKNFEFKRVHNHHFSWKAEDDRTVYDICPAVTVITGEKTPRGGYYVANAVTETAVSPHQVLRRAYIKLDSDERMLDLHFRPAVTVDYPKI